MTFLTDSISTPYYKYNDVLCPKIWDMNDDKTYTMKPDVRTHLLDIIKDFKKFVDIKELNDPKFVLDIILTGSSAGYNWTDHSDVDLHIMLDYDAFYSHEFKVIVAKLLRTKTQLWNLTREVTIRGFNVELYPQDKTEAHYASGMFSIKHNKWIKEPEFKPPQVSEMSVKQKFDQYKHSINLLLSTKCSSPEQTKRLLDRITKMRKSGLEKGGEFSVENLVFKKLRNVHLLDKLHDCDTKRIDTKLSIT